MWRIFHKDDMLFRHRSPSHTSSRLAGSRMHSHDPASFWGRPEPQSLTLTSPHRQPCVNEIYPTQTVGVHDRVHKYVSQVSLGGSTGRSCISRWTRLILSAPHHQLPSGLDTSTSWFVPCGLTRQKHPNLHTPAAITNAEIEQGQTCQAFPSLLLGQ